MSFLKKMKLAAETAKDVAKDAIQGNEILATDEEKENRMNVCRGCPYFVKGHNRCNQCGCFMKLKTELKSAKCPIGKW